MNASSPIQRSANPVDKRAALALAIVVHLILAAFLFYGVHWQTQATDVVEVELVRAAPLTVSPAPTPEPVAEPQPEPKTAPRAEPRSAPPPPKPDIAIKAEPKPRLDSFLEQLKREAERLTQRKNTDAATEELAKEKTAREASARNKAMTDYIGRIRGKIRGNIVPPPGVQGNPEAVFTVTQLPSGEIITVHLKRSSGNAALDGAIERAIRKSSPLPKPEQNDIFNRDLELKFRPLDD